MKLCIYALCKNEIEYIEKWLESVKQADEIIVVDTGSTDGTWEVLQKSNVKCYQKIFEPYRSDTAKNYALSLVPNDTDICLPLDIDMELYPNCISELKTYWEKDLTILYYKQYFKTSNSYGKLCAHSRNNCRWIYPSFEQIAFKGKYKTLNKVLLTHFTKFEHEKAKEIFKTQKLFI